MKRGEFVRERGIGKEAKRGRDAPSLQVSCGSPFVYSKYVGKVLLNVCC